MTTVDIFYMKYSSKNGLKKYIQGTIRVGEGRRSGSFVGYKRSQARAAARTRRSLINARHATFGSLRRVSLPPDVWPRARVHHGHDSRASITP